METRDEVLYQALSKNEEEIQKWMRYKTDHEDAVKNLEEFRKKMSIEVMVPIGSKALMPGYLTHTNEVFVSHFGKVVSKCTSYQAQEICKNRIKIGKEFIIKLEIEKDMYRNNLEIPYAQDAVSGSERQEIIEEYDEQREKEWREEHKKRVRAAKLNEKNTTNKEVKTHESVIKKLDELELLDELEAELQDLNINDDDTLKKLMSGEMKFPEKQRVSHYNTQHKVNNFMGDNLFQKELINSDSHAKCELNKNYEVDHHVDFTNNYKIQDSQISTFTLDDDVHEMSDSSSDEDIPEDFIQYRVEAEKLDSYQKKVSFIRKKIKLIEKEIDSMKVATPKDLDRKLDKIETRDYLIDYALILEDEENSYLKTDAENDFYTKNITISGKESENKLKKNRISFVLENDVTYIDQNEKVEDMLIKKRGEYGKDKIVLNSEFQNQNKMETIRFNNQSNLTILDRVQKSIYHMQEKQSHEDFDLVSKILSPNKNINILQIKFKHSSCTNKYHENNDDNGAIASPVDFYKMFGEHYPQNLIEPIFTLNENEKENLNELSSENISKELESEATCKDGGEKLNETVNEFNNAKKKQFEEKQVLRNGQSHGFPTILKNKDAVKREHHYQKQNDKKKNEDSISKIILGDVIANPEPQKYDDLSNVNFISTHAPKKRISRFKQSRTLKLP